MWNTWNLKHLEFGIPSPWNTGIWNTWNMENWKLKHLKFGTPSPWNTGIWNTWNMEHWNLEHLGLGMLDFGTLEFVHSFGFDFLAALE